MEEAGDPQEREGFASVIVSWLVNASACRVAYGLPQLACLEPLLQLGSCCCAVTPQCTVQPILQANEHATVHGRPPTRCAHPPRCAKTTRRWRLRWMPGQLLALPTRTP